MTQNISLGIPINRNSLQRAPFEEINPHDNLIMSDSHNYLVPYTQSITFYFQQEQSNNKKNVIPKIMNK